MSNIISIEVFLSENGVFLAAPRDCGLEYASRLILDRESRSLTALNGDEILPLELPELSDAHCDAVLSGDRIAIGEFAMQGVAAAYFLPVQVA